MPRPYIAQSFFLAAAAASLLAASQISRPPDWSTAGLYVYWTTRIFIEAGLFIAFALLMDRIPVLKTRYLLSMMMAAIVSLFPFALSITMLDIILGLPELEMLPLHAGVADTANLANGSTRVGSFLKELIYLSDNHLALCLLLSAPRLFSNQPQPRSVPERSDPETVDILETESNTQTPTADTSGPGYTRHLESPLKGRLLRVEAQEHYIRLICEFESRMLLYRFNDIVSELSGDAGMQIHRSHWVAFSSVEKLLQKDGRLWLEIKDGTRVPVSRRYVQNVQRQFVN